MSLQAKYGNYKPFIITLIYRPPGKPVELFRYIDNLFGTIDSEDKEAIYIGDMNCDLLYHTNNDTKNLMRLFTKFSLCQITKCPTRTTVSTKTIIDHIFTNRQVAVAECGVIACGISDHDAVYMIKSMRLPKLKVPPKILSVRNYKWFDAVAFKHDLNNVPHHFS